MNFLQPSWFEHWYNKTWIGLRLLSVPRFLCGMCKSVIYTVNTECSSWSDFIHNFAETPFCFPIIMFSLSAPMPVTDCTSIPSLPRKFSRLQNMVFAVPLLSSHSHNLPCRHASLVSSLSCVWYQTRNQKNHYINHLLFLFLMKQLACVWWFCLLSLIRSI